MEEYVRLYDECMYNMHSEEADLLNHKGELYYDMQEEFEQFPF